MRELSKKIGTLGSPKLNSNSSTVFNLLAGIESIGYCFLSDQYKYQYLPLISSPDHLSMDIL